MLDVSSYKQPVVFDEQCKVAVYSICLCILWIYFHSSNMPHVYSKEEKPQHWASWWYPRSGLRCRQLDLLWLVMLWWMSAQWGRAWTSRVWFSHLRVQTEGCWGYLCQKEAFHIFFPHHPQGCFSRVITSRQKWLLHKFKSISLLHLIWGLCYSLAKTWVKS